MSGYIESAMNVFLREADLVGKVVIVRLISASVTSLTHRTQHTHLIATQIYTHALRILLYDRLHEQLSRSTDVELIIDVIPRFIARMY